MLLKGARWLNSALLGINAFLMGISILVIAKSQAFALLVHG